MKKRLSWIDVVRGIGIFFVVYGHIYIGGEINRWIYSFHMPLFFILSGYLWNKSGNNEIKFSSFLIKRIKTLLVPFVIFRLLLIVYWLIIESHFRLLDLGPIWFLITLFVAEIMLYGILKNNREKISKNIIVCLCLIVILYCISFLEHNSTIGAWVERFIDGTMWYAIGHLLGLCETKIYIKIKEEHKYVILLILFVCSMLCAFFNENISIWSNKYGNYILFLLGGLFGTLFIFVFAKWIIKSNKVIEWYGNNSLLILATHEPIKRIILFLVERILSICGLNDSLQRIQTNILISLIISIVVLVIEIVICYFFKNIKKRCPKVIRDNLLLFIS